MIQSFIALPNFKPCFILRVIYVYLLVVDGKDAFCGTQNK